jgi:hypothetical protein
MAWDADKPAASSLLSSAELRSNWAALETSLMAANWVADPNFYIWSVETANGAASQTVPPDHWALSGTGAVVQRCGTGLTDTTDLMGDGWVTKLSYGSATAYLNQALVAGTIPTWLQGQRMSFAINVKGSGSSVARAYMYDNDTGYTYSNYNTGTSTEWLSGTHTVGAGTTGLGFGVELGSGSCHIQGGTVILGDIPPIYFIPARAVIGCASQYTVGTLAAGFPANLPLMHFARPTLALSCNYSFRTGPTSSGVYTVQKYDASAAAFVDIHPDLTVATGVRVASTESMSTTYADRCLSAWFGTAASASWVEGGVLPYITTPAGAADLLTELRGLQFVRPQDAFTAYADVTKHGS